jgi:NO-binding membrane sensor protein with MHYT domain
MGDVLNGSYDYRLVLLSIVVAVVGGQAGLELARRAMAGPRVRFDWLMAASAAIAVGIWSMHYTGMLALRLPVPVWIHWPTAVLSYAIAAASAATALWIMARSPNRRLTSVVAAFVIGGPGISGLHYTAMESMRFHGEHVYLPGFVVVAVIVAILLSDVAFRHAFAVPLNDRSRLHRSLSAVLMGAPICTMHYTAMAGTVFAKAPVSPDLTNALSVSFLGTAALGLVTLLILGVAIATSTVDRLSKARTDLQGSFEQLRALAARLQHVREEERTNVAREIHDELGQALTSIKIELAALVADLPSGTNPAVARAKAVMQVVDDTIQRVRRIATELRPGVLDDLGLVAAVEWAAGEFQKRTGVKCDVSVPAKDELPMDRERATALFRILQETLTNVARHANATHVRVRRCPDSC